MQTAPGYERGAEQIHSLGTPAACTFDSEYDQLASLGTYVLRVGALLGQASDAQDGAEGATLPVFEAGATLRPIAGKKARVKTHILARAHREMLNGTAICGPASTNV